MTFAKSPKHFAAKEEKLRKKNLPYQRKKTKARYRKNFYLKRALKKIQPNAPIERTSIERTLRKKAERKSHRKRYNSMAYFKRKAKKPASLGTLEKRASKIHPKTATQVEEILAIRSLKIHWQNLFLLSIDDILKGANH